MTHQSKGILFFLIGSFFVLLFIQTRGFLPHDEGWIVNPAYRLLQGETPYKDFHFIYFPGSLFLTAIILSLTQSLLLLRLTATIVSFLSLILIFSITRSLTKQIQMPLLAGTLYLVFGPLSINFLAPSILAIFTSLLTVYLLFQKNTSSVLIVLAGITTSLTMLFKQNFGLAILLTCLCGVIITNKHTRETIKLYILGFLLGWLPALIYLFSINGLYAFIQDTLYFTFEKTFTMGLQVTPFIYPGTIFSVIPKTILYLLPAILSILACIIAFKKNKSMLPFCLFTFFFYMFGIRPTTDYIHLVILLSVTGIPLTVVLSQVSSHVVKRAILFCCYLLIAIGLYTIVFRHYYRWEDPILLHTSFSNHPRVFLFVNNKSSESIEEIQLIIDRHTTDDYIFIYDYLPMYYFLTNTKNPTRFDFFPPLSEKDVSEILSDLEEKKVSVIITTSDISNDTSPIGQYILKHYTGEKINHFYIWRRTIYTAFSFARR